MPTSEKRQEEDIRTPALFVAAGDARYRDFHRVSEVEKVPASPCCVRSRPRPWSARARAGLPPSEMDERGAALERTLAHCELRHLGAPSGRVVALRRVTGQQPLKRQALETARRVDEHREVCLPTTSSLCAAAAGCRSGRLLGHVKAAIE